MKVAVNENQSQEGVAIWSAVTDEKSAVFFERGGFSPETFP
ncbi:MAG: hypothetical protein QM755_06775 [Luteolibacter sp.]